MWRPSRRHLSFGAILLVATAVTWLVVTVVDEAPAALDRGDASDPTPKKSPLGRDKRVVTDAERSELLRRAKVWRRPRTQIATAAFDGANLDEISCRFEVDVLGGTTPKFDCSLDTGEEVRIKYGNGPEAPAETASTRLLHTLGFGADDVRLVRKLRCFGCPMEPFSVMKTVEITRTEPLYERLIDYNRFREFEWVALERKMEARPIQTETVEGWSFFELDNVQVEQGGAPRAHVDGLRLMAILLAHWDNKAENQRMVCLSKDWPDQTPCPEPFLLLQDVGATFGPPKMDFEAWRAVPIWDDRASCTVSMRSLPFEGATFGTATVTEAGRQFVGGLLAQLSEDQLTALFSSARFGENRALMSQPTPIADWVRVFKEKVRTITDGPACPQR